MNDSLMGDWVTGYVCCVWGEGRGDAVMHKQSQSFTAFGLRPANDKLESVTSGRETEKIKTGHNDFCTPDLRHSFKCVRLGQQGKRS